MSASDFRDYLVQEGQRQQAVQRLEDLMGDPARQAADVEQALEDGARDQIAELAERADDMDDALGTVLTDARTLRNEIQSGSLTVDEAKAALLDLRQRHGRVTHSVKTMRPRYDALAQQAKDPAGRRDELIAKYGI